MQGTQTQTMIVVIATHDRPDLLERTLQSLGACRPPDGYGCCVVVENGGQRGAEAVVRRAPRWLNSQYRYSALANKSAALNLVLEEIDDSLIVFLDDDIRLSPDTLCAYCEAAEGIQSGRFFGGPIGVDYESPPPEWLKAYLPFSAKGMRLGDCRDKDGNPLFLGANWAAFADDVRRAGCFDPSIGGGASVCTVGEETDMQRRLYRRGFQGVCVPEAMVWHYVPAKRCSKSWAMRRAYRHAIAYGVNYADDSPTLFGFPRWMVRQWLEKMLRCAVARFTQPEQAQFSACFEWYSFSGMMIGKRHARRMQRQINNQNS